MAIRIAHGLGLCCFFVLLPGVVSCSGRTPANETVATVAEKVTTSQVVCGVSDKGGVCTLTITEDPANNKITYDIFQPVVNQEFTNYPVSFQPGDQVTLEAGGCVQTGGAGDTWKRYVDPSSDEPSHFFGTISVPGAATPSGGIINGEHIQDVLAATGSGTTFTIPTNPCLTSTPDSQLILGYTDDSDDFDDNGYYDHDDSAQCAGADGQSAHVRFTVVHGVPGPWPSPTRDFDLVPHCLDDNFVFLNPRWNWQTPSRQPPQLSFFSPDSSQTPAYDITSTSVFVPALCDSGTGGHLNWFDVTYTGPARWSDHSSSGAKGDDDYNVFITPDTVAGTTFPAGVTLNNPSQVKIEFDAGETVENFQSVPWWDNVQRAVADGDDNDPSYEIAHRYFDKRDLIVTGLMGVDGVHNNDSEVHPAQVFFLRMEQQLNHPYPDPTDDGWAFFVRNWGDEGMCSSAQHYLDANTIQVRVHKPDAVPQGTMPALVTTIGWAHEANGPMVWTVEGDYVVFSFPMPPGEKEAMYYGEVHIQWVRPAAAASAAAPAPAPPRAAAATNAASIVTGAGGASGGGTDPADPGEPEDALLQVWSEFTPSQQATANRLFSELYQRPASVGDQPLNLVFSATPSPKPTHVPSVRTAPATEKLRRDKARDSAWCAATSGALPEFPGVCVTVAPVTEATVSLAIPSANNCFFNPHLVTLQALDASGTGIDFTEWSLDGGVTWRRYAAPFYVSDGQTVSFRAHDHHGNVGDTRKVLVPEPGYDVNPDRTAIFAQGNLSIEDGVIIRDATAPHGQLVNAGSGQTTIGVTADVGNIFSRASITLRDRSRVDGSIVTTGGVFYQNGVTVTGSVSTGKAQSLLDMSACSVTFPSSTVDVNLEPDQKRTLAPASYRQVAVKSRATLSLSAGTYFFDSLQMEPTSRIVLDQRLGPVFILVRTHWDPKGSFVDPSGALAAAFVGFFGTESVYMVAPFTGTVVAPHALVYLTGIQAPGYLGALFSHDVDVSPYTSFTQRPYSFWAAH
jgi:hypothetical protein